MHKANCIPASSALEGEPHRRPRPSRVAYHRDHGMMGSGPSPYAGPRRRVFTLGIGGPVGSGKTALVERLCQAFWPAVDLAVITNDIYTREDAEFLARRQALPLERIVGVETGGCPHSAIREDASINLAALADLEAKFPKLSVVLIESGGDNLAATFSPELADRTIYVIDVAEGDKIPRKGGPGICRSDLLVINKTDLAPHVGADLSVMDRDSRRMRGDRPFLMLSLRTGTGVEELLQWVRTLSSNHGRGLRDPAGTPALAVGRRGRGPDWRCASQPECRPRKHTPGRLLSAGAVARAAALSLRAGATRLAVPPQPNGRPHGWRWSLGAGAGGGWQPGCGRGAVGHARSPCGSRPVYSAVALAGSRWSGVGVAAGPHHSIPRVSLLSAGRR